MVQICQGLKTKNDMLVENIELYKEMFLKIKRDMGRIIEVRPTFPSLWWFIEFASQCRDPLARTKCRL